LVALLQCFSRPFHKPWTHWAGIVLCLLHAGPALAQVGPVFWRSLDSVCEFLGIFLN
jgi:hypothetical protein